MQYSPRFGVRTKYHAPAIQGVAGKDKEDAD